MTAHHERHPLDYEQIFDVQLNTTKQELAEAEAARLKAIEENDRLDAIVRMQRERQCDLDNPREQISIHKVKENTVSLVRNEAVLVASFLARNRVKHDMRRRGRRFWTIEEEMREWREAEQIWAVDTYLANAINHERVEGLALGRRGGIYSYCNRSSRSPGVSIPYSHAGRRNEETSYFREVTDGEIAIYSLVGWQNKFAGLVRRAAVNAARNS